MITLDIGHPEPFKALAQMGKRICLHKARADQTHDYEAYLDFTSVQRLENPINSEHLEKLLEVPAAEPSAFPLRVGFLGYELLAANFGVQTKAPRDLKLPAALLARPCSRILITGKSMQIQSYLPNRAVELCKIAITPMPETHLPDSFEEITCNLSLEQYKKIFQQAKEHILDGNTYQIKISMRYNTATPLPPLLAFEKLAATNPAPESFAMVWDDFSLVSCSPETVIHKEGEKIVTKPIGGTIPRDDDLAEEEQIEKLLKDPKETAEHNMLIDLERNDLSNICQPGSVEIEKLREVEHYAHLHHLVSTISGTLLPNISTSEILKAMLPGGTITGCPKHRTMEIIDQLEPSFRGPYTGSYGTFHDTGDLHLNLIIRTLIQTESSAHIQAGGGIVVDSTPEYEYNENRVKAQALLDLLRTETVK
jgi:para-aminobenzoate synthetase component 1